MVLMSTSLQKIVDVGYISGEWDETEFSFFNEGSLF